MEDSILDWIVLWSGILLFIVLIFRSYVLRKDLNDKVK